MSGLSSSSSSTSNGIATFPIPYARRPVTEITAFVQDVFSWVENRFSTEQKAPQAHNYALIIPTPPLVLPSTEPRIVELPQGERIDDGVREQWEVLRNVEIPPPAVDEDGWVITTEDLLSESRAYLLSQRRDRIAFEGQVNLMPYLCTAIQQGALKDDDLVTFKEGALVRLTPAQGKEAKLAPSIFAYLLSLTYGEELAETVSGRYELNKRGALTWKLLKQCFVGVAANVKVSDLRALFAQLKKCCLQDGDFLCALYLTQQQIDRVCAAESFDALTPEQMRILEIPFRTLPYDDQQISTLDLLFQGCAPKLPVWQFDCFCHDAQLLKGLASLNQCNSNYPCLATSEHLSKNLAYIELKVGMLIPLILEQKTCYYQVESKLEERGEGVVSVLLCPVNDFQVDGGNAIALHLIYRGTELQPARKDPLSSALRDVEPADGKGV